MQAKRWLVILAAFSLLFSLSYLMLGCSEDDDASPSGPTDGQYTANSTADCQGCHTNEDMLKATVTPDDVAQVALADGYAPRMAAGEG